MPTDRDDIALRAAQEIRSLACLRDNHVLLHESVCGVKKNKHFFALILMDRGDPVHSYTLFTGDTTQVQSNDVIRESSEDYECIRSQICQQMKKKGYKPLRYFGATSWPQLR